MKKILSLVLVLTLVLSMGTVALVASAAGNSFSLSADKTSAAVGEQITVTYSIDSLSNGLFAMAENA
ncbi:MAG: hypothetical protein ACI4II_08865, partial [Acutalibacteraceae bacterium]